MARKRAISEELLIDEEFNALSLEGQNLFVRMLSVADDCGVVPADQYRLEKITNPPPSVRKRLDATLQEIVGNGLGRVIEHNGKPFFTFKPDSFVSHQGHILNKRTRSEYLKMSVEEYDSGNFPDFPGYSTPKDKTPISGVESRKKRVESRKQKDTEVVPDSLDSVRDYFREMGDESQAEAWWDHFSGNGFKVGKAGLPMKDWKATVRTWLRNKKEWGNGKSGQGGYVSGGQRRIITAEDNKRVADAAAAIKASRAGRDQ